MNATPKTQLERAADRLLSGPMGDPFDGVVPATAVALVRESIARLGWSTMGYKCDACGYVVRVWTALGVEGPPALREGGLYVASPFTVRCFACAGPTEPPKNPPPPPFDKRPLNGKMAHTFHAGDHQFGPMLIPDDAPWFALPAAVWRGDHGAELVIPEAALVAARRWFFEDAPDAPPDFEEPFA